MRFQRNAGTWRARVIGVAGALAALTAAPAIGRAQDSGGQPCQAGSNPDVMIAACTRVIEAKGTSTQDLAAAHLIRGAALRDKKQLDPAIKDETEALRLEPNLLDAHVIRGTMYGIKKDFGAALQDFNTVLQVEPNNVIVLGNRGAIYMQMQQYAKAIPDFQKIVKLKPQTGDAHHQLGMAYRLAGQQEAAFHEFDATLRVQPDNVLALTDLAVAYLDGLGVAKDPKKGAELLDQAAKLGFEPAKQMLARVNAPKP